MHDTQRPADPSPRQRTWEMFVPVLKARAPLLCFAVSLNVIQGIAISFQMLMPKYLTDDVLLAPASRGNARYVRLAELVAAYLFATIFARMIAWHFSMRIFTRVREEILFNLRARFFRHIHSLCLRFHGRTNSGELFSYLFGTPLTQVQQFLLVLTTSAPGAIFTLLTSLIWVWRWDWLMTLVLTGSVLASVGLMQRTRTKIQELHQDFQSVEGGVSGQVSDLIRGQRDVKLYAMEEQVIERFEEQAHRVGRKIAERDIVSHLYYMQPEGLNYVFFGLLCSVGAWRYLSHGLKLGEVQAYLGAFIALQFPLGQLMQVSTALGGAKASLARLNDVFGTESTTPDPPHPVQGTLAGGDIVLRDLHFAYGSEPTLRGINLHIPYGQRIAFVGPSGSGKTTLAQLILRLYLPASGKISVNGINIHDSRGSDLRRVFGIVPQDPYFFRTTIRDNLRVACPTADDEGIRRACEAANAWGFVEAMPARLDTPVGEGGSTLSGGQKQRLAIARALLHDPSYFIFDEATSALDTVSERLIQESLEQAIAGRTALFIAHRLATVRTCDRIVVLEAGRIVQDGGYEELAGQPGLFKTLVENDALLR